MALAVADAERVGGETLLAGDGEDDGGIHAAGDEDDCFFHRIKLEIKDLEGVITISARHPARQEYGAAATQGADDRA
ncbi:hypothetical protein GCM10027084_18950 [Pseudoxanthomonas sangjuensis]